MHEQSKAARRRSNIPSFHNRYFVGHGIDIGAGNDSLANFRHVFRGLNDVIGWDIKDGDANYLHGLADNAFDFAVSSHCLEHMVFPKLAIDNWLRIVKPGGYLIVTIPDEEMYEQGVWPSRFNSDHKWSFTTKVNSAMPKSINLLNFISIFNNIAVLEKIEVIHDFYQEGRKLQDQTLNPCVESSIEFILRKL